MQRKKDSSTIDPLEGTAYRTLRLLGQGGMGQVFEAEHKGLGKRVVVKLLHASIAADPRYADRLRVEAQTLASLSSPYLVSVSDLGITPEGRPFFVMEHLTGSTFRKVLSARTALPPSEAIHMMRQALAGLAAAHRIGIVHRDIKLDNLFLCAPSGERGPVTKVLDFGVAKVLAGIGASIAPRYETAEGTLIGSPRYMSPEQASFQPVDARTDIYAAGVVLYTLITGQGPFPEATDALDLLRAHVATIPQPPSRVAPQFVPPELDKAVLKAMAKKPDQRFQSADEFAEELGRIADLLAAMSITQVSAPPASRKRRVEPEEASEAETLVVPRRNAAPDPPEADSAALTLPSKPRAPAPARAAPIGDERRMFLVLTLGSALFFTVVIVIALRAWGVV